VLALSIPIHAALRIGHWYRDGYPYLEGAAEAAAAVSTREDLFMCNERTSSAFLFYLDRRGWAWEADEMSFDDGLKFMNDKIAQGARFYATSATRLGMPGLERWAGLVRSRFDQVYAKGDLLIFRLKGSSASRRAK
jgi:hypothetical protein